ncbi:MAG TPA: tripartite tricarboxylate transporter substrate binding protein, partial [Terriglobia bacterium]|nr:tripartite tricarboxylate transporter substrate binding protein [Terriglobia bacterium]
RLIQPKLEQLLGVPVAVINRPGGGGAVGAAEVARAPADGYRVLAAANSVLTILPATVSNPGFSPADFTPLGGYLSDWTAVAVPAASAWKSIEQFIEFARKNPGKARFGTEGEATASHFVLWQLQHAAQLPVEPVPLGGSREVIETLRQEQIAIAAASLAILLPHLASGALRPLLLTSADRLSAYPDVPTLYEKGYSDFELGVWMGLFVKAGTSKEISDRLAAALSQVMQDSAVYEAADRAGLIVDYRNPDATRRQLARESEAIRAAVAELRSPEPSAAPSP